MSEAKIKGEADYVVWRDSVVVPSRQQKTVGKKAPGVSELKSPLPDADPGHIVAHRWRKRFCAKTQRRGMQ